MNSDDAPIADAVPATSASLQKRLDDMTALAADRAQQLVEMEAKLARAESDERQRLGRFIHDHLQQLLAAAKLRLSMVRRSRSPDDEQVTRDLNEVDKLLMEAIQASRDVTKDLKS